VKLGDSTAGGEPKTKTETLKKVLAESSSGHAAVDTAGDILGVVEQCGRVFEAGGVATRVVL
jgi:hypothetical protein